MNIMIDGTERYKISPTPQCCNYAFFIGFMQMQNRRMTVSLAFLENLSALDVYLSRTFHQFSTVVPIYKPHRKVHIRVQGRCIACQAMDLVRINTND